MWVCALHQHLSRAFLHYSTVIVARVPVCFLACVALLPGGCAACSSRIVTIPTNTRAISRSAPISSSLRCSNVCCKAANGAGACCQYKCSLAWATHMGNPLRLTHTKRCVTVQNNSWNQHNTNFRSLQRVITQRKILRWHPQQRLTSVACPGLAQQQRQQCEQQPWLSAVSCALTLNPYLLKFNFVLALSLL